jgi:BirA family biotin operon repressor/biotin-[acetyl-CoA-carboxylase] ligase
LTKLIRETLINALASGSFVSGQQLGQELGVSRTAVSKHVKALIEMGLDVFSVTGKGYKLAQPLILLSNNQITANLAKADQDNVIEIHQILDSTNSYLLRKINQKEEQSLKQGQVCIAEYQSAGRGRRGRQWVSPYGSHLYLSYYWQLEQGMSAAMGLSLVVAIAVSDAIKSLYKINVQLKWPNDIYIGGVKLAGILVDLEGQASGPSHSVIGIGINLKMPSASADAIDQPWTDLQSHCKEDIDRNKLCVALIISLNNRLNQHQEHGLSAMLEQWHAQDVFLNKAVNIITGDRLTPGICRGINNQGALQLEVDGVIKTIYGGEVSLRGAH